MSTLAAARVTERRLIADADAAFLDDARHNLASEGYEVETAADGRRALECATARAPDPPFAPLSIADCHVKLCMS